MALTKVKLIADGVITSANLDASHGITTSDIGEGSNLYYTDSRVSSYLSTNGFATQTDIVAAITDSAPVTLDTLNELAAALGDDPNFATTTATSLGLKAPLASPSFTGNATFAGNITVGTGGEIRTSDGYGIRLRNAANSANEGGFVRSGLWEGDSSRDPSLFAETGLNLRFYTGGSATERMVITSGGDVIIGGTVVENPNSVNRAFEVAAASPVGLILNDTRDANPITLENVGAVFHISHGTNRRLTILDSSGNVGIGTTSPSEKLHVNSGTGNVPALFESTDNLSLITFKDNNTTTDVGIGADDNDEVFYAGGSERMRISSGGTVKADAFAPLDNGTSVIDFATDNVIKLFTTSTERMRIDSSGQIKTQNRNFAKESNYGYSSAYKALVLGSTGTNTSTNSTTVSINYDPSGNAYSGFSGDGREVLFRRGVQFVTPNSADNDMFLYNLVLKDGNVGIGTNSPSANKPNGSLIGTGWSVSNNTALEISAPNSASSGANSGLFLRNSDSSTGTDITSDNYFGNTFIDNRYDNDNGDIYFRTRTAGTPQTRMIIEGGGNVGIGTTSPSAPVHIKSAIEGMLWLDSSGNTASLQFRDNGTIRGLMGFSNGSSIWTGADDHDMVFRSESKMHFVSNTNDHGISIVDGKVGIGTTSPGYMLHVQSDSSSTSAAFFRPNVIGSGDPAEPTTVFIDGQKAAALDVNRFYSHGTIINIRQNNSNVGSISVTGVATAYNTSSDYRLKEDYQDFNGLDIVSNIPVYDFKWKSAEERSFGVKAHELQNILPQAVNGEKDAKEMQGVDYSKLTPILLKAIQELKADNDNLRERIQTLENQ